MNSRQALGPPLPLVLAPFHSLGEAAGRFKASTRAQPRILSSSYFDMTEAVEL